MSLLLAFQGAAAPDDLVSWKPDYAEDLEDDAPEAEFAAAGGIFESPVDVALLVRPDAGEDLAVDEDLEESWLPRPQLDDVVVFQPQDELLDDDAGVDEDLVGVEIFDAPAPAVDLVLVVLDADADPADDELAGEDLAWPGSAQIEDAPAVAQADEFIVRARRRRRR